jgi:hypothetical protein
VSAIERERCADLPPLPPERRRRGRCVLSHDQYRVLRHYVVDLERLVLANYAIGMVGALFSGVFGSPNAPPHLAFLYSARIIKFPERRNELGELRAEIEEMRKTVSVC